tara:strand:- start:594 stop:869 length:276 start_codon:yes stop_codon:yes gene_type:complete
MPAEIFDQGKIRKRFDKAVKTGPDYILSFLDDPDEDVICKLRIKRDVDKRNRRRGALIKALTFQLHKRFGVDKEIYKEAARHGGEVKLRRR